MRFANDNRQSFELAVSGYEPSAGEWLYVKGDASDGSRNWTFHQPCLTRRDVRDLARWLRAVADGKTNRSEIDFLEPNLAFEKVGAEGSSLVIRVIFGLEALPPWDDDARTHEPGGRVWLDFSLTPEQLREASGDLRAQIEALERQRWPLARPEARG
jgi:hypothetical protein